ncbi:MAG: tetratricopeptide repeat protein [Bacteroidota bacterium]|jgi:tetratricopeptide (TPR) repeat protein
MKPYISTAINPLLCDDCQQLGYCRKNRQAAKVDFFSKFYEVLSTPNPEYHFMKDADIINLVPVKTMVKDYFITTGKKLQQAHDLFHQDEYEQASYLYRDLITQRADYEEAELGLAACYYFMKNYEEAAAVATSVSRFAYNDRLSAFLDACERSAKEIVKAEEERVEYISLGHHEKASLKF